MKYAVALVLLLGGCAGDAERRLLIIHEAKLVLRHSNPDPTWAMRKAQLEADILVEDPDAR